jgi:hypothetical protein
VHKAVEAVERYTLAVFYNAPMALPIFSKSVLAHDTRYGENDGGYCTYSHWNEASFKRYLVTEKS